MGKHHETVDIAADILKDASEGCGKTKIMCRANLSYPLLCKYLGLVCCCGLLNNGSKNFELTRKEMDFLKRHSAYDKKLKHIADSLLHLSSDRKMFMQTLEVFEQFGGFVI